MYEQLDEIINGETSKKGLRNSKKIRSKERRLRRRLQKEKPGKAIDESEWEESDSEDSCDEED